MRATKIRMNHGFGTANDLLEIESIYLTGVKEEKFYKKEILHEHLNKNPGTIQVDIYPYPNVIPAIGPSPNREKYVKSSPNSSTIDNLLSLPRE